MTERQFLDRQYRRIRDRIRRDSIGLHDEIERAIGPVVREHPRLSVAAGASAGLVLGRVLGFPSRLSTPGAGAVAGGIRFIKETGTFVLRSMIVNSLLSSSDKTETSSDAPAGPSGQDSGGGS